MLKYKILKIDKDFKIININKNTKGSRKKKIVVLLKSKPLKLGFFKYEKYNCSEACSEKLAYEVAKILKIPCARIEFARDENKELGIISYLFIDDQHRHTDAIDLFNKPEFDRKEFLMITSIKRFLDAYGNREFEKFVRLMVFDSLIGETDRHEENWGLLKNNNKYQLSPLYDSGCNLLREFKDGKFAQKYYDGTKDFEKYILNSKTCIYKEDKKTKYKHFELIQYLYQQYPNIVTKELNNLRRINKFRIKLILIKLPKNIITNKHKEYIYKYILKRKELLLNIVKEDEN